jgi:hypothetical protein
MVANCPSLETCTQDSTGVVECGLIPLEERLPVVWPVSSDTLSNPPRSLKTRGLTAVETRAQDSTFVTQCSLTGLEDRLPLIWPISPDTPPSPKKNYRSHYVYLGWDDLLDPTAWEYLSDFDLILRLVDLSPLRDMLAHLLGWTSARGQTPFDPITIFLLIGWQITNHWSRAELLRRTRAMQTMSDALASRMAFSPPKAGCAIGSPPWADILLPKKPFSWMKNDSLKSPSSVSITSLPRP